ncbi:centrosomal protein kizuna isoform X1 [Seriola aureovittata]|uniref:centrosomal protein kizuna isoform X1 n=2 Tax=Seriola aureovittata TaxID=2871759 RepID=UPI0024BD7694|nr:centrosomal protein kizuna isoform X1 [Seriola aureovittata]
MPSMTHSEDNYYEKITSIQQSMSKREKRRLELERELFAYSRSDKRTSQIKCSKLRSYLKEISDREARAKMRNLELLRDVECIEISMKEYSPDHGPLQQQQADFFKNVSKCMQEKKKMKKDLEAAKMKAVRRKHQDSSVSHAAKNFTQSPAVIFMDYQTSRGSDVEAGTTSVHSHQALHRSPNHSMQSRERLPSGLLKDFRVGGEDATSNRAHLSDDISGSNDSPDGCNLSDKHERMMAVLPSVCALTGTAGSVPFGSDDEQEPSPLVTLTAPEKNPSPSSRGPIRAKNSPADHTNSQEVAHQPLIMEAGERGLNHLMPETTFGKEAKDTPGKCECVSTASSDVQLSESSASDLSISLTQSELEEEDLPEGVEPKRNATSGGSEDHNQHSPESSLHSDGSKNTSSAVTLESLSQEGLFNLLDSIEGRFHDERTNVYGDSSVDEGQLNRLISLCNAGAGLNDEDLEACGAVVLHGLQRLSWSTAKGCLLPQDLVSSHQSSPEPNEISTSLPPDAARLWDRWFKHALLLKERRVLNTERLVQLFTPLLLERHATYSHQAKVLLRTLLSRSSEECPSAEDKSDLSSSCGPPSLLADCDVKPARPVQRQWIQELQSTEEDSQDESPVESVPIRETKAYQLLKQSAMQERLQSSEEEEDEWEEEEEEEEEDGLSGINHGNEEDLGRAKRSSHQDPYPRREKTHSKAHSAIRSEAFWGESDDSNAEIEAALRPQPFNANNDDTDDFYD